MVFQKEWALLSSIKPKATPINFIAANTSIAPTTLVELYIANSAEIAVNTSNPIQVKVVLLILKQ